jgi:hypothetical protein
MLEGVTRSEVTMVAIGGALEPERHLLGLALVYVPFVAGGAWLSLRYGVGAVPGGDPARDLAFRGTGLAPPLFLPVALVGAAVVARRQDRVGAGALVVTGLVGLAFTAGSTLNLPNDVAAARDAGSPVGLTVGFAVFHWFLGPALAVSSFLALRRRARALGSGVGPTGEQGVAPRR